MAVVVSADIKPYREVLQGLREAARCGIQEVALRDGDPLERISSISPDVVVAIGTDAFRKVRPLRDLPLVHVMVIPSEAKSVRSANRSGVSMDIAPATWFATMKRLFPNVKRVGVPYNPENTGAFVSEAQRAAREAGIDLVTRDVRGPDDVPQALTGMNAIDVLWMLPDPTVAAPPMVEHLIRHSIRYRVPIMTFSKKYLDMGAVASLDVDPRDMGLQAGELANGVAQGAITGASRYARRPVLSVNGRAAEKMGIALNRAAMWEQVNDE
jgi:putative ABC transport system substrate-binding protein